MEQSGDEALATISAGLDIDVLLTDISMPGALDGWALAERVRQLQPQLSIIYATNERQDPARRLTGSEFVPKPYQVEAIVAAIHRVTSAQEGARVPPPAKDELTRPGTSDALPQ